MTNTEKYLKNGVNIQELADAFIAFSREQENKSVNACICNFFKMETNPTLTENERIILRNIGERWKFLARDNLNRLYVRTGHKKDCETICPFDHLFQFIKERRRILY